LISAGCAATAYLLSLKHAVIMLNISHKDVFNMESQGYTLLAAVFSIMIDRVVSDSGTLPSIPGRTWLLWEWDGLHRLSPPWRPRDSQRHRLGCDGGQSPPITAAASICSVWSACALMSSTVRGHSALSLTPTTRVQALMSSRAQNRAKHGLRRRAQPLTSDNPTLTFCFSPAML
jgi:hypothetical protein